MIGVSVPPVWVAAEGMGSVCVDVDATASVCVAVPFASARQASSSA